jgi:hypothetical protein
MGMSASAELVYGILIRHGEYDKDTYEFKPSLYVYDEEEGEDPEDAYWSFRPAYGDDFGDVLDIVTFGHCDDEEWEEPRGVLTIKELPSFRADTWSPKAIGPELQHGPSDALIEKANQECERLGFPDRFSRETGWVLVVSYG